MEDRGIVAAVMRRWSVVLLAALLVAGAAVVFDYVRPERNQATSSFFVREKVTSSVGMLEIPQGPAYTDQDWRTLAAPIRSQALIEAALQETGIEIEDMEDFIEDDVDFSSEDQTHVSTLRVTVEGSAEQAEALNAEMLAALDEKIVADYVAELDDRIALVEAQLDPAWERVRKLPSDARSTVELPVDGGTDAYDSLSQQYAELQVAREGTKSLVEIMDAPLSERVNPAPLRSGLVGLAAGVLAGLGVALLLDASDRRRERAAA